MFLQLELARPELCEVFDDGDEFDELESFDIIESVLLRILFFTFESFEMLPLSMRELFLPIFAAVDAT